MYEKTPLLNLAENILLVGSIFSNILLQINQGLPKKWNCSSKISNKIKEKGKKMNHGIQGLYLV